MKFTIALLIATASTRANLIDTMIEKWEHDLEDLDNLMEEDLSELGRCPRGYTVTSAGKCKKVSLEEDLSEVRGCPTGFLPMKGDCLPAGLLRGLRRKSSRAPTVKKANGPSMEVLPAHYVQEEDLTEIRRCPRNYRPIKGRCLPEHYNLDEDLSELGRCPRGYTVTSAGKCKKVSLEEDLSELFFEPRDCPHPARAGAITYL